MEIKELQKIIEGALMAAGRPLTVDDLMGLFGSEEAYRPARDEVKAALEDIETDCRDRGFELKQVASGYRFQVRQEVSQWISRLWEEKPQKYSRALLETLAIIAYRQPVTRSEIEEIRGVSVSSNIVKTLLEREWIRVVGHRDVPGRPAILATTRKFLDYFNLRRLDDLPPLSEIKDLVEIAPELGLEDQLKAQIQDDGVQEVGQEKPFEDPLEPSSEDVLVDPNKDLNSDELNKEYIEELESESDFNSRPGLDTNEESEDRVAD